ncbi:hypothetical protein D0B32_20290 [Paraburkholderia sp. DHOC27]|nr:hypothetical protein D0B32_20290 [Paraburkholderia sp. DHOC27]
MLHAASVFSGAARKSMCIAGISVLAACTTVSNVDARRDGHLILTSKARWSIISWNHVKNVGLKRAAAYCKAQNAQYHLVAVHTEGVWGATDQVVEVVFDCF